jgi:hypothetical protein
MITAAEIVARPARGTPGEMITAAEIVARPARGVAGEAVRVWETPRARAAEVR